MLFEMLTVYEGGLLLIKLALTYTKKANPPFLASLWVKQDRMRLLHLQSEKEHMMYPA